VANEAALRYELAGELGRLYGNKTEILGLVEGRAPGVDRADIPDGSPRTIWLFVLAALARLRKREEIGQLLDLAAQRSSEVDWRRFEVLRREIAPADPQAEAVAQQWTHLSLEVHWAGERAELREQTFVASGQVLVEVTATMQWSGPARPTLTPTTRTSDGIAALWCNVQALACTETASDGVAVWTAQFVAKPHRLRTRTIIVIWQNEKQRCFERRRLVPRSGAMLAACIWLVGVGLFPLFWLRPLHITPAYLATSALGGLTALTAFGARALDASGIRSWIQSALAIWERACIAAIVVIAATVVVPVLGTVQITNLTGAEVELDDGTTLATASMRVLWKWNSRVATALLNTELCTCGESVCHCTASSGGVRWVTQLGIRCHEGDCGHSVELIKNGGTGTIKSVAGFTPNGEIVFGEGTMTSAISILSGKPPANALELEKVEQQNVVTVPVGAVRPYSIWFHNDGWLTCDFPNPHVRTLGLAGSDAALLDAKQITGRAGKESFTWRWDPEDSAADARACVSGKSEQWSFVALGLQCSGPFDRIFALDVSPPIRSTLKILSGENKVTSTSTPRQSAVAWICTGGDGPALLPNDLPNGTRIGFARDGQFGFAVGDRVATCKKGYAWLVAVPPNVPTSIGSAQVYRLGKKRALVCTDMEALPNDSQVKGQETCSFERNEIVCRRSPIAYTGDCVQTGSGAVIKRIQALCAVSKQPVDGSSELAANIKATALKTERYKCKNVFTCAD